MNKYLLLGLAMLASSPIYCVGDSFCDGSGYDELKELRFLQSGNADQDDLEACAEKYGWSPGKVNDLMQYVPAVCSSCYEKEKGCVACPKNSECGEIYCSDCVELDCPSCLSPLAKSDECGSGCESLSGGEVDAALEFMRSGGVDLSPLAKTAVIGSLMLGRCPPNLTDEEKAKLINFSLPPVSQHGAMYCPLGAGEEGIDIIGGCPPCSSPCSTNDSLESERRSPNLTPEEKAELENFSLPFVSRRGATYCPLGARVVSRRGAMYCPL